MKKFLTICFCLALLAVTTRPARATYTHDGVEIQPIDFGQIVVTNNTTAQSCTIPAGGVMTCSANITILQPGQYGIFRLSNYDPTVAITATVAAQTALTGPNTSTFSISNFTFAPNIDATGGTAQTPPGGTLTLYIGATLTTTAGQTYSLAPYRGTYTLQINY